MELNALLKSRGQSVAFVANTVGCTKQVFYNVFAGRTPGFPPDVARKIIRTWPEWNLQWEDLLFYKERFLSDPKPALTADEQRTVAGLVEPLVLWGKERPEAREFIFRRLQGEWGGES